MKNEQFRLTQEVVRAYSEAMRSPNRCLSAMATTNPVTRAYVGQSIEALQNMRPFLGDTTPLPSRGSYINKDLITTALGHVRFLMRMLLSRVTGGLEELEEALIDMLSAPQPCDEKPTPADGAPANAKRTVTVTLGDEEDRVITIDDLEIVIRKTKKTNK